MCYMRQTFTFAVLSAGLLAQGVSSSVCARQIDLTEVFAVPTEEELQVVRGEWAARFPTANNWAIIASGTDSAGRLMQVVRHDIVPSGVHYAALRFPPNFDPLASYPVVLCLHGGNDGVSLGIFGMYDNMAGTAIDECSGRPAILVAPSYRCEPLLAGQLGTFNSTGDCTMEDYEVDDVMSLLGGVLENVAAADESHVVGWGYSHGGGVLLGVLARDHRVRAGVDFYGPADVFQSSSQAESEALIAAGGCDLPGSWRLVVCDFIEGVTSLSQTRIDLLRHSRGWFVDQITRLDVHHGTVDPTVDVVQSRLLAAHAQAADLSPALFRYFEYPTGVHSIASLSGYLPRFRQFMCAAFNLPVRRVGDIDENGAVNAGDLTLLLSAWAVVTATHRADLNADHRVDAADLAIMLSAWGP